MTDRRDPEEEEDLRELLADLESTLVELRGELTEEHRDPPRIPRGLPGAGRRPPRPPRFRDVLRFTEEYTIPTLISILEANIRLLRLAGAAIRGLDPERSTLRDTGDGAVGRAFDAGREVSTDRLSSGLAELNDAIAGTDAPDPAARELLSEAESLSAEIQERLREVGRESSASRGSDFGEEAVHIDVTRSDEEDEASTDAPEPDVAAELDSIRDEVRGPADDEDVDGGESDDDGGEDADDGSDEDADDGDDSEDADGTPLE